MSDSSIRTKPSIDEPSNMMSPDNAFSNCDAGTSTFLLMPRISVNCSRMNRTSRSRASSRTSCFVAPAVSAGSSWARSARDRGASARARLLVWSFATRRNLPYDARHCQSIHARFAASDQRMDRRDGSRDHTVLAILLVAHERQIMRTLSCDRCARAYRLRRPRHGSRKGKSTTGR